MPRPLTVLLDVTSRCNLKCVMCYFSAVDRLSFPPADRPMDRNGDMSVATFERIAADLFPRARRASLGCTAEPLIHPDFAELVACAGRHHVPDLWFPTNLLPLTEAKARAIVRARVRTVGVSADGFTAETYETIRVGSTWTGFVERLELLREVSAKSRTLGGRAPRLRFIFTWMRSNRDQLRLLPEFAERHGAGEIDVRYVCPTVGVDNSGELLTDEDPVELNGELAATAREAVARGLTLSSYPEFEDSASGNRTLGGRVRRRLFRLRAGLDRPEYWRHRRLERRHGCAYPGTTFVVRPNGAVFPCQYWRDGPIGLVPDSDLEGLMRSEPLVRIRDGLARGRPVGSCSNCNARRDAFYRPFTSPEPNPASSSNRG